MLKREQNNRQALRPDWYVHQVDQEHHNICTAGGSNEGFAKPSRDVVLMMVGIWCNSYEAVMLKTKKNIYNIIPDTRNVLDTKIEVIVNSTKYSILTRAMISDDLQAPFSNTFTTV